MQDRVIDLWKSNQPNSYQGIDFMLSRGIDLNNAIKRGVCSDSEKIYFIYHKNGIPVRWKSREILDKKKQLFSKADEDNVGIPFFSQFKAPWCDYLIITEGEFDCLILTQLGASNCVSLPNGSGSVKISFANNYEFLQQFEVIYLAFDMDEPGKEAAKLAMQLLPPSKYRRINFPPGCKDANEWFLKCDPKLSDLDFLMENSSKIETNSIVDMGKLPDYFYDPIDLGVPTGYQKLDNIILGFRKGEVTVITAETGAGKTTISLNFIKNLCDKGKKCWINTYESIPNMANRKYASILLRETLKINEFTKELRADYENLISGKCYLNIVSRGVDTKKLREDFELAAYIFKIEYILLDHLDYIFHHEKGKSHLENIDAVVKEIHSLAVEFNIGVFLIVHPKQKMKNETISMHDLKGSSSIKQYADNILILKRDTDDSNPFSSRVKISVEKNRLMGITNYFYLYYDSMSDSYFEDINQK